MPQSGQLAVVEMFGSSIRLVAVALAMLGSQCPLADRSSGALTGSRVAGAFGLVPVCDAARSHERSWKSHAFKLKHNDAIALFTWVDNLYAVSNEVRGCISILEDVEGHLGRV